VSHHLFWAKKIPSTYSTTWLCNLFHLQTNSNNYTYLDPLLAFDKNKALCPAMLPLIWILSLKKSLYKLCWKIDRITQGYNLVWIDWPAHQSMWMKLVVCRRKYSTQQIVRYLPLTVSAYLYVVWFVQLAPHAFLLTNERIIVFHFWLYLPVYLL
jgi:hypothetical protein